MSTEMDLSGLYQTSPWPTLLQTIRVEGIRVAADIGVHTYEMGRRQALIVAVTVTLRPVEADDLGLTLDYNCIVAAALALADQRTALIETYARRLAEACLVPSMVLEVHVVVEKPGALTNGVASTQLRLRRGD